LSLFPSQDGSNVVPETLEERYSFFRGFDHFAFVEKYFPSFAFYQRSHTLAHAPAGVPEDLQAVGARHQEHDAFIAQHTDGFGKAVEGLEFEAGKVELLELFGGIRHFQQSAISI
jgi:hypothetical protein